MIKLIFVYGVYKLSSSCCKVIFKKAIMYGVRASTCVVVIVCFLSCPDLTRETGLPFDEDIENVSVAQTLASQHFPIYDFQARADFFIVKISGRVAPYTTTRTAYL